MIRGWSCIIDINSTLNSVFTFKKSFRILMFRRFIRFKKYVKKTTITKLKRKPFIRLKHKTNWLPYFYVLRMWCRDFLFVRQLTSFEYINKFYLNSFYFFNFNRSHMSNNFIANNFNFVYGIITRKLYLYLNLKLLSYPHGNRIMIAFCDETPIYDKTAVPGLYDWSTQLTNFEPNFEKHFNFESYFNFFFKYLFTQILEINKSLIILFFINITKFKNVK